MTGGQTTPYQWPMHFENDGTNITMDIEFCLENKDGSDQRECLFTGIPVTEAADRDYEIIFNNESLDANHENCSVAELDGSLHIEGTPFAIDPVT